MSGGEGTETALRLEVLAGDKQRRMRFGSSEGHLWPDKSRSRATHALAHTEIPTSVTHPGRRQLLVANTWLSLLGPLWPQSSVM